MFFSSSSTELCEAIAATARKICSSHVAPKALEPLVACCLIALDKCPGVRPIGIRETVRRIIRRTILNILKDDIRSVTGPLQLCAGHEAGCEAAIHALREIFSSSATEAVILVDASNAFNSLNREVALRNIQHLSPFSPTPIAMISHYTSTVKRCFLRKAPLKVTL